MARSTCKFCVWGGLLIRIGAMLRGSSMLLLSALLLFVVLVDAQAQTKTGCDPSLAASMIGKRYSRELAEEARRASGANSVRPIGLDFPSSADSRLDRLNVEVDQAGIVTGFRCG